MIWYMTYDTTTGKGLAENQVRPKEVEAGEAIAEYDKTRRSRWDEATKAYYEVPAKKPVSYDQLQKMLTDPELVAMPEVTFRRMMLSRGTDLLNPDIDLSWLGSRRLEEIKGSVRDV